MVFTNRRRELAVLLPFDEADCLGLAEAIWHEAGVDAHSAAPGRAARLTQGQPFYADVTCREAANIARRLEEPISAGMVDGAFVSGVLLPQGQIAIE